jgi:glutamyl-tRNA reductase
LGEEQQPTHRESSDSSADRIRAERTRAREIRHLLSKLSLSVEQAEVIEGFSRSLVEEIIRGPIAETVALTKAPSEPVANVETLHARGEEGSTC